MRGEGGMQKVGRGGGVEGVLFGGALPNCLDKHLFVRDKEERGEKECWNGLNCRGEVNKVVYMGSQSSSEARHCSSIF